MSAAGGGGGGGRTHPLAISNAMNRVRLIGAAFSNLARRCKPRRTILYPRPMSTGADIIRDQVKRLPDAPGVYRMIGDEAEVLYVGKARSLKKRVSQYAQGRFHTQRIANMVHLTRAME